MFVFGGWGKNPNRQIDMDVYDSDTCEWQKFKCGQKFRHCSWVTDSNLYVFGGFDNMHPQLPTNTLLKLDLGMMFIEEDKILNTILEHVIESNK